MKFLVLVLAVAVVAGNIFHRPFSTQLNPSWPIVSSPAYQHPFLSNKGSYYHQSQPKDCEEHQNYFPFYDYFPFYPYPTNIQQGVYSGQPRSPAAKKNDQSQDWQKILKQRSRWNQKFFLLDNEAQTVHALRPFNPLEMFSYHINQIKPSAPLTRPIFARRSTVFFTITETTRKIDVQICIPSTLFTSPSLPTQCPTYNRTIRHFKSYVDLLKGDEHIRPSSASPVMPTVLDIQSQQSPVYSIESSKDEDLNEERDLGYYEKEELTRRDRAMFGWPTTRTVTVVATQTSIVTRAVSPMHPPIGSPTGLLICVPPGLVVCV